MALFTEAFAYWTHPCCMHRAWGSWDAVGWDAPPGCEAGQQSPLLMFSVCHFPFLAPVLPFYSSARGWPAAEHKMAACIPRFLQKRHKYAQTLQSRKGAMLSFLAPVVCRPGCTLLHPAPMLTTSKLHQSDCLLGAICPYQTSLSKHRSWLGFKAWATLTWAKWPW